MKEVPEEFKHLDERLLKWFETGSIKDCEYFLFKLRTNTAELKDRQIFYKPLTAYCRLAENHQLDKKQLYEFIETHYNKEVIPFLNQE